MVDMTTRLDLRTAMRQQLEDTSGTPLWDDATLNDFLDTAMRHYGVRFPREQTTTVAVTAGELRIPVTPEIEAEQVQRIFDADGVLVPRQQAFDPHDTPAVVTGQAWRWWNSTLILNQPAAGAGDWTIEHRAGRSLPDDDTTAADIIPGDEEIVVQLAIAAALRRRAIEDGKRGFGRHDSTVTLAAEHATTRAGQLIAARFRRARGGWLTVT
jgi:hypothetical protein